jgi:hypothetical protein
MAFVRLVAVALIAVSLSATAQLDENVYKPGAPVESVHALDPSKSRELYRYCSVCSPGLWLYNNRQSLK